MNNKVSVDIETVYPIMEEKLASGGSVCFSPKGTSMLPLIRQGIDSVKISPVNRRLKKYDVPLYRRKNGQFVLHRVVAVRDDEYIMCGDNQYELEYGIHDSSIIGLMTEIITPHGVTKVTDSEYIRYSKRIVFKRRFKRYVIPIKRMIKRFLKKLHLYR